MTPCNNPICDICPGNGTYQHNAVGSVVERVPLKKVPLFLGEGPDRIEVGNVEIVPTAEGPMAGRVNVNPEHYDAVFGEIMTINPLMRPRSTGFTIGPLPDDLETS